MALSIRSSSASYSAQHNLGRATESLNNTFERLSSGLRINKASDDPAGLAIADKLRADTAIASQAIRNANDGVSLIAVAEGALEEIGNMLESMAELAEQSSSGTLTNVQRSPLQSEFEALGSEIYRISHNTEFNSTNLLYQSTDISIQVGLDSSSNSQININSVLGTLSALNLGSTDTAQMDYQLSGPTSTVAQTNSTNALTAVKSAVDIVANTRGTLGAAESRLSSAISNLESLRENLSTAESQIRDVDVAVEAAELVRLQIVQQAASAVLAQANQQPGLALTLLT